MKKGNKGFTLIELLVVIAIIAILSTVVMAGLNSARSKGRDAKRLSDIKQVQAALELFFDSCGGYSSAASFAALSASATGGVACLPANTTFGSFMNPLPANPSPGGIAYQYAQVSSGSSYTVLLMLEGQSGSLSGLVTHTATPSGIL